MGTVSGGEWELRLLGSWRLTRRAESLSTGVRQQRLIAMLALLGPRARGYLASVLWPESSEAHAAGSMRTCLFEVSHHLPTLIQTTSEGLALSPTVSVDVDALRHLAREIVATGTSAAGIDAVDALAGADLLPGWYDDWVVFQQEQWTQERLSALDAFAEYSLSRTDPNAAIRAAMAAIAIEPLRESAYLRLVAGHLQAGNHFAATRAYERLLEELDRELGVAPSQRFTELLARQPIASRR